MNFPTMTYTNFDQIMEAEHVNATDRIQFTRKWLSQSYDIKNADENWITVLANVHDHDNLPKHFGAYKVGSSFSATMTQLVRLPDGWHLAIGADEQNLTPIHPKQETGSYSHPLNMKLRMQLTNVLKKGKLVLERQNPTRNDNFDLFAAEDKEVQEAETGNNNAVTLNPTFGVGTKDTKSISIF
jgi:hypothetical protein